MTITKASLILNGRDQNSNTIKTTIGYVNPEIISGTDTAVVSAAKARLLAFAQAVNGLTTNSLLNVQIQTTEDITNV